MPLDSFCTMRSDAIIFSEPPAPMATSMLLQYDVFGETPFKTTVSQQASEAVDATNGLYDPLVLAVPLVTVVPTLVEDDIPALVPLQRSKPRGKPPAIRRPPRQQSCKHILPLRTDPTFYAENRAAIIRFLTSDDSSSR